MVESTPVSGNNAYDKESEDPQITPSQLVDACRKYFISNSDDDKANVSLEDDDNPVYHIFSEYLEAINHLSSVKQLGIIPVKDFVHNTLIDLFNRYAIIGGMPEIIQTYIQNKRITDLPRIYESIWGHGPPCWFIVNPL